jgi:hypothetical protein
MDYVPYLVPERRLNLSATHSQTMATAGSLARLWGPG